MTSPLNRQAALLLDRLLQFQNGEHRGAFAGASRARAGHRRALGGRHALQHPLQRQLPGSLGVLRQRRGHDRPVPVPHHRREVRAQQAASRREYPAYPTDAPGRRGDVGQLQANAGRGPGQARRSGLPPAKGRSPPAGR